MMMPTGTVEEEQEPLDTVAYTVVGGGMARKTLLILGMGMVAAASKNQLTVRPGLPPVI